MLRLAKIKGGSHLYGLNNADSDNDFYEIVALSPSEIAFDIINLRHGDAAGPGEVDDHEIDVVTLCTGYLDTMWALELLFADPEDDYEVAPEWNRLRDMRKNLCTPALVQQIYYRLQNCVSRYATYIRPTEEKEGEWRVVENFSSKPVDASNLAHAYRMAVQCMNYITTRDLFGSTFKLDRDAYARLKENVVTIEDVKECLQTLVGLGMLKSQGVGISGEFYESPETKAVLWEIVNSTTVAAIGTESPAIEYFQSTHEA